MDAQELTLVPLSALQHYGYCPRQCALIHVEQLFDENLFTMKGRWAHAKVDEEHVRSSGKFKILTALPVWSDKYGLTGKCDVVEMRDDGPHPVEFKHGIRKAHIWDDMQLCAQAVCLEEMFQVSIPDGDIFHISSKRRRRVRFTPDLKQQTLGVAAAVRQLLDERQLPPAVNDERCVNCSLVDACLPSQTNGQDDINWKDFLERMGELNDA